MANGVVYTGFDPEFGSRLNQLIARAKAEGYTPSLISGVRAAYAWPGMKGQSQADLYSQLGKPGGPRAAAPPGYSPHQYGVAGDVTGIPQSELERLAPLVGLRAIHSDPNHLELAGWQQEAAAQPPRTAWDQSAPANVPSQMAMNMEGDSPPPGMSLNTTPFTGVNPNARGMRNNNPGNLEANSWTAKLPGYRGSDGRFAIFDTLANGAAALDNNLQNYAQKGINTPLGVANRWAPPGENNSTSYGSQIAKGLGVAPDARIDLTDPSIRARIAQSIAMVENGPGKGTAVEPGIGSGIPTPAQPNAAAVAAETPPPNLNPFQKLFTRPEPTKDAQGNDVQGKSPIEKIASGLGGAAKGGQQQQAGAPQPAQFAPVQDPMAQMAGPAAQLYSTVQAQAAKPLSWSSRPYGWDAGLQMTPGMSLNTTGYG